MKVLVTGNKGYVGNVLTHQLLMQGFEVIGCDIDYFPQDFINLELPHLKNLKKDIRDLTENDVEGCSAVIHLAGLSNDPLGELNPSLTNDVNFLATVNLAKIAKNTGVERFIFSSSCSTYGANSEIVDEMSKLAPITAYAKSKVDSEYELIKMKDEAFAPTILRNATVYGISPSQRLDLVVNNLVCSAVTTGKIKILSDGTAWRPLLHVEDMANAFVTVLKSPLEMINGEIFNVGSNKDNFTVKEIATKIEETIPNTEIEFAENANKDTRSYKVNFDKIHKKIEYNTKWNLKEGIKHIYQQIKNKNFVESDFKDIQYYRVSYIKSLIEKGFLDTNLRFKNV